MTPNEFANAVKAKLDELLEGRAEVLTLPVEEIPAQAVLVLNPDPRPRAKGGLGIHKISSARWFTVFTPREGPLPIASDMAHDLATNKVGFSTPSLTRQVNEYLAAKAAA
jgi:hypothetical protein